MARRARNLARQNSSERGRSRWPRSIALHGYFGHTAFDIDTQTVWENHSRAYLEHRLRQVDAWLAYLVEHSATPYSDSRHLYDPHVQEQRMASEVMDFAYLEAVRHAISETLKAI